MLFAIVTGMQESGIVFLESGRSILELSIAESVWSRYKMPHDHLNPAAPLSGLVALSAP